MEKVLEKLIKKYDDKITYYEKTSVGNNDIASLSMVRAYKEIWGDLKELSSIKVAGETSKVEELLDCIKNLVGVFDNPIFRRKFNSFSKEAVDIGKEIIDRYSTSPTLQGDNKESKAGIENKCGSFQIKGFDLFLMICGGPSFSPLIKSYKIIYEGKDCLATIVPQVEPAEHNVKVSVSPRNTFDDIGNGAGKDVILFFDKI